MPLFVVLLGGLSHVVDQHRLLDTVASNLQLVIPGQAAAATVQVENFLAHREVVGVVGLLALVFFSSTAFTVIESAMAIIFYHRMRTQHRHFLVSVLLPYLFMMLIGVGLLLITVISSALHAVRAVRVFGRVAGGADTLRARLGRGRHRDRALGGDPACHDVVLRHALDGERDLWGDGRTIVVLLTLEAAAVILLFGGEVIAEIDRARVERARTRRAPAPTDDGVRASHRRRAGPRFDRRGRL